MPSSHDVKLVLDLTVNYLLEESDRWKDGWLLDEILPQTSMLSKGFSENKRVTEYLSFRRAQFAEFTRRRWDWKGYKEECKDNAFWRASHSIPKCPRRPLLSWGPGNVVTFLEK